MAKAPILVLVLSGALFGQIDFTIDQSQSNFSGELCILEECDTDGSTLSGTQRVVIECPDDARAISSEAFFGQVDSDLAWDLRYGILGRIDVDASNLSIRQLGDPTPFVPVTAGDFQIPNVPADLTGIISFQASGVICELIKAQGLECDGTIDLSEQSNTTITLLGRLEVGSDDLTIAAEFDETIILDPDNPDLGTLTLQGQFRSTADRPDTSLLKKFKSKCNGSKLVSKVKFVDASLSGTDAIYDVNGERVAVTIKGKKAKLKAKDQTGPKTIRLIEPPNCFEVASVDCG